MWGRAHLDTVEVMKNELNGTMSKNSKGSFSIALQSSLFLRKTRERIQERDGFIPLSTPSRSGS